MLNPECSMDGFFLWRTGVDKFVEQWLAQGWFYSHWSTLDQVNMFRYLFFRLCLVYGDEDMAKRQDEGNKRDDNWGGFVPHRLGDEEKEGFRSWKVSLVKAFEDLAGYVWDGYKLTVSADFGTRTVTATLTGHGGYSDGRRRSLTARAPEVGDALRLLVYKHKVLLGEDWTTVAERVAADYE